jgi:hypothetical protein
MMHGQTYIKFTSNSLTQINVFANEVPVWIKYGNKYEKLYIDSLNAELNPICHLLALLGAHHILHVSEIRVKKPRNFVYRSDCSLWYILTEDFRCFHSSF